MLFNSPTNKLSLNIDISDRNDQSSIYILLEIGQGQVYNPRGHRRLEVPLKSK